MLRVVHSVSFWFLLWFYTGILFIKMVAIYFSHRGSSALDRSNAVHRLASEWGEGLLKITPGWTYELVGIEELEKIKDQPLVLVANHASAVDIWALFTTQLSFRWLSKDTVFKLPMIGTAMKWAGYVPIRRGDKSSHQQAMRQSAKWLEQGVSMMFFPEGSRSKDGKLKSFKPGAFRLAMSSQVPILPVVLHGTSRMLSKNSLLLNPASVRIQILEACYPLAGESAEDFMERVRAKIKEQLEKADELAKIA